MPSRLASSDGLAQRHCEERSGEAISAQDAAEIASHSLAMTPRDSDGRGRDSPR
jgi:hypothetical protein